MNDNTLRLGDVQRGREIHFVVDGKPAVAYEGETIATALTAAGVRTFRLTPDGKPRGLFCGIGACYDCVVSLDGRNVRACLTPVCEGMIVVTQPAAIAEQRS